MSFKLNTNNRSRSVQAADSEKDEFDGLWINVGPVMDVTDADGNETEKFVRVPRGIAVSDLKPHKIYANTNPEWAQEAQLINQVIDLIREKASTLAEGESVPVSLAVQLYRRQETTSEVTANAVDKDELAATLFG